MPASELKTVSCRWSVNTEMRTMTAQIVFPPWKKIVGSSGWIIDEVALMCLGHTYTGVKNLMRQSQSVLFRLQLSTTRLNF